MLCYFEPSSENVEMPSSEQRHNRYMAAGPSPIGRNTLDRPGTPAKVTGSAIETRSFYAKDTSSTPDSSSRKPSYDKPKNGKWQCVIPLRTNLTGVILLSYMPTATPSTHSFLTGTPDFSRKLKMELDSPTDSRSQHRNATNSPSLPPN
jgi:hypothetical protein